MKHLAKYCFYGEKNSGKTSLMSKVITKLVDGGYRVAAVKHTRGDYSLDREGTDTYKHGDAGAEVVVFSTPVETSFIIKEQIDVQDIMEVISSIGISDVVLFEGFKEEKITGIEVSSKSGWTEEEIEDIVLDIEYEINVFNILNQLPLTDCGKCGFDTCYMMARSVVDGDVLFEDCTQTTAVKLKVNGSDIQLSEFPAEMIKQTIVGMLKSLKGVEEVKHVCIEFSAGDKR